MAEKDSEGMSPVEESSKHVEESPELNRNPEPREKDKPLKKTEVSREKRKTASQSSSSKNVCVEEQLH